MAHFLNLKKSSHHEIEEVDYSETSRHPQPTTRTLQHTFLYYRFVVGDGGLFRE
jgi:hypothetical protein